MSIEKDLAVSMPSRDALDVHPHGTHCDMHLQAHKFNLEYEACGFTYKICGRCGTIRISEKRL